MHSKLQLTTLNDLSHHCHISTTDEKLIVVQARVICVY